MCQPVGMRRNSFTHSFWVDARLSTARPKLRCCSGVFIRQSSRPNRSAARQARAASPARTSRNERARDAFGAGGRANRRKHGGQASCPSSSVTHSRQNVPPQCGHRADASRSGWNKQRAWRKPIVVGRRRSAAGFSGAICLGYSRDRTGIRRRGSGLSREFRG